jgi:glycosyltransferase involved in cell wall biosynthesis
VSEIPLISVVIPAWNAASVIAQTLESARTQTFRNFEAIIVDDGSTDDTAAVVRRFCETNARSILIQQPHGGVSVTRNTAIERARGEWIAFLDADDVWLPQKLERQVNLSREDPRANLLFTNYFFWDGERDLSVYYPDGRSLPEGDATRELIFGDMFGMATGMVRRETLRVAGLFDPDLPLSQDWDMWLRIGERGLWARGLREPLVRYRRWPGSRTMNRLKSAENNARVLEKNLRATQRPELRPLYRRSLNAALVACEFLRAAQLVESNPDAIPAHLWRVWRREPRWKWLRWYLRLVWPECLGGGLTRRVVLRKIQDRWR